QARDLLARFLFRGDRIEQPVGTLSGGERSRLALAKLSADDVNVLLLDEPTNHLDIAAREAIEDVLTSYNGTILFVTHDRTLINTRATKPWLIGAGHVAVYDGAVIEPPQPELQPRRSAPPSGRRPDQQADTREQARRAREVAQLEAM